MKKYINGQYVECTPEEIACAEKQRLLYAIEESRRPMTESEVIAMLITQQVNSLSVDDNTALRMRQYYPTFDSLAGQTLPQGYKFQYGGKLWSVVQPSLTIQSHYPPGAGTESLYAEVCETHAGTLDDPIPYSGNMTLELGKYYMQDYTIYKCIRATVNPVYHNLPDLVGLYVEEMNE